MLTSQVVSEPDPPPDHIATPSSAGPHIHDQFRPPRGSSPEAHHRGNCRFRPPRGSSPEAGQASRFRDTGFRGASARGSILSASVALGFRVASVLGVTQTSFRDTGFRGASVRGSILSASVALGFRVASVRGSPRPASVMLSFLGASVRGSDMSASVELPCRRLASAPPPNAWFTWARSNRFDSSISSFARCADIWRQLRCCPMAADLEHHLSEVIGSSSPSPAAVRKKRQQRREAAEECIAEGQRGSLSQSRSQDTPASTTTCTHPMEQQAGETTTLRLHVPTRGYMPEFRKDSP